MKKHFFFKKMLLLLAVGWLSSGVYAQCIQPNNFGTSAIPVSGAPTTNFGAWAGEYTNFTGLVTGETYSFSSSNTGDFLTLTNVSNAVLVFGTTPLTWTATFDGAVRVHISVNSGCGTQNTNRDITAQCTTCTPPPPGPCISPNASATVNAPSTPTPLSMNTCNVAGQYNTVNNIENGTEYQFTSSIATDWLTLTDVSNNVIAFGTTPLTWTADFFGTVRIHISLSSACEPQALCRATTITCTTCLPPPPGACIQPNLFGTSAIPISGAPTTNIGVWAGEFTNFTGTITGESYSFSSSLATDWLTLTDVSNNILAFGTTPLTWTATFDGAVRVHVSVDSGCGAQNTGRNITAQCTTCTPPPPGPCIAPTAFAIVNAPISPSPLTISTCTFAGQYNTINNIVDGSDYQFASSIATDWLTLTDASDNVIAFGTTPLVWTADFDGTVRLHVSSSSACDPQFSCRATTVTCASCPVPPPGPCITPNAFLTVNAPGTPTPLTISTCTFAGQYNTINNIVDGSDYQFTSSIATDWLTLTDASNNVIAFGTTPLVWTADFDGTVRLHVSLNSACDPQSACRTTTVACTSCVAPPPGPCIQPNSFGTSLIPVTGTPTTNFGVWAGEFTNFTGTITGESYSFSSSIATDWLTLTDVSNNVIAFGTTPLTWTATFDGAVRVHISVDSGCGTQNTGRSITAQCTTCTPPPPPACASNFVVTPTPGCDNYPTQISWDAAASATNYRITVGTTSGGNDVANNLTIGNVLNYTIGSLSLNTQYFYTVTPFNSTGDAVGCAEQNFTTGNIGCACVPTYSVGKTSGDLISNVEIPGTTLANNTGTAQVNPAFTYFTGQPNYTADLVQGGSYNVTISIGVWGDQAIRAWIDYNDDGVFDNTESIGFTTVGSGFNAAGFPPAVFNVNLSNSAPLGTHRMRIRGAYFQDAATLSPCLEYTFGETEDYDVTIVPPLTTQLRAIDCGATNVTMNQILRAVQVGGQNYRFRVSGANNGGPGWNNDQFIYDTPNGQNHFRFQFIPGSAWGATYAVEVAVGDGFGNYGPYGNSCNVTLENQTTTQITAATCGSTVTMDNFVVADWAPGAVGYRFRIQGANNGGAGWSGNTFIYETTAPVRSFKFNNHIPGSLFGETYSIDVAVLSGNGNWLPYGSACNVTIATPSTQIQASQCGITGVALPTSILADNVVGAAGYRFRITGANSANWMNSQTILNRPNRVIQFQMVAGVLAGEVYQIEVAVMDANGNYGAYGTSCNVTLEGTPSIVINDENEIFMDNKSLVEVAFGANASHNPFTTEFGIQVLNANDTETINVVIYDMSGKLIERNAVNPMDIEAAKFGSNLASGMYMIEVRQGSNQAVIRQVKN